MSRPVVVLRYYGGLSSREIADLREISTDVIAGYFFNVGSPPLMKAVTANKFNLPDVDRIFDAGNFTIYAVRRLW